MCGRFTLKTPPAQWSQLLLPIVDFQPLLAGWQPRYNIAPTQDILALACEAENAAYATYFRWGLLPKWATELSIGSRMINARRETLAEKKSFATPLATRRCLIIADGYYEWRPEKAGKQAYWISPKDGGVMQFAGLWEQNSKIGPQPIRSCTIITTAAAANLAAIHDRMPVVLTDAAAAQWLDPHCELEEAQALLAAAQSNFLQPRKVSSHVNNARNDDPQCLA